MADRREGEGEGDDPQRWLARFHAGRRDVLEACYREHFRDVEVAICKVLKGADQETAIHDVFLGLIESAHLRESFRGGSFRAWLTTVARNHAIDVWRRRRLESNYAASGENRDVTHDRETEQGGSVERQAEARLLAARLLRENLSPDLLAVFEARFVGGLDQRAAAAKLGISRTTLAYREMKVRRALQRHISAERER